MNQLHQRIDALSRLGQALGSALESTNDQRHEWLKERIALSFHKNGWFTEREVKYALNYWATALQRKSLESWTQRYEPSVAPGMRIGLILAGNIPLVGFHDVLSVLLSGHVARIKCSSTDNVLLPALLNWLTDIDHTAASWFHIEENFLSDYDAVIATGSNNSARHFEQYFSDVPHIIRRNRTGVAVLDGSESDAEVEGLMEDALRYFGLGCRNTTKLYLPEGFDLHRIFKASLPFAYVMDNKKYANNYTYHKTLMMMERKEVLENEVILLTQSEQLYSPVSVLHYSSYSDPNAVKEELVRRKSEIQCVTGHGFIPFGRAQQPALHDYADGVDTVNFLRKLRAHKASK